MTIWHKLTVLLAGLVLLYLGTLGYFSYRDQRDLRFYHFDAKTIIKLETMPNTCDTCILADLPQGVPYLLRISTMELTPLESGDHTIASPGDGVCMPDLKANLCDLCLDELEVEYSDKEYLGYALVWPIPPRIAHAQFMPISEHATLLARDAYYFHVDKTALFTYNLHIIPMSQ